eukprot:5511772-Pleurochrysis_carterae.AAC.9
MGLGAHQVLINHQVTGLLALRALGLFATEGKAASVPVTAWRCVTCEGMKAASCTSTTVVLRAKCKQSACASNVMLTAFLVAHLPVRRLLPARLIAARLHAVGARHLGVHHARRSPSPPSVRGRHPVRIHIPAKGAGSSSSATLAIVRDAREQLNERRMNRPDLTSLTCVTDATPAQAVGARAASRFPAWSEQAR